MSEPTPSLAAETEAIRAAYAALNRGDIPGFVQVFDPQIVRIEPAGKAIQFRTFADERQALEWVGLQPADAD